MTATITLTGPTHTVLYSANVDKAGVQVSVDGGVTWTTRPFPPVGAGTVNDMSWPTPSIGLVAATTGLFRTADEGRSWASVDGGSWSGVWMADASIGWCVGPSATMKKTVDGGVSWAAVSLPDIGGLDLVDVCAASANVAYACGDGGTVPSPILLKTTDGTTWAAVVTGVAAGKALYAVGTVAGSDGSFACVSASSYMPAADKVYSTSNGGTTWVSAAGWMGSPVRPIVCLSSQLALAGGCGGYIDRTERTGDAGTTWSAVTMPSTSIHWYGLACSGSQLWAQGIAFPGGSGLIAWSGNGGTSWSVVQGLPAAGNLLAVITGCTGNVPALVLGVV